MKKRIILDKEETNFLIDENGNIKNEKTNRLLKGGINKGVHFYSLHYKGKQYILYTHRTVAKYFVPNPNNFNYVKHKDGNKLNNNFNNLEWADSSICKNNGRSSTKRKITDIDFSGLHQFRNSQYYADKDGNIYNKVNRTIMSYEKSGKYYRVRLIINGVSSHYQVHRIIWESFNGEIPDGYDIDHKDRNTSNNSISNLEPLTHRENTKRADHNNIKVKGTHYETKEERVFSSLSECSRKLWHCRNAGFIKKCIEQNIPLKGFHLEYA